MTTASVYSIGKPGQKWGDDEKAKWRLAQVIKRSYQAEVVVKIDALRDIFNVTEYGVLDYEEGRYPLYAVKNRSWNTALPTVLITGGVHGYETSGVQGAIRFLEKAASVYSDKLNLIVAPCVSPWGYETINRWNPMAIDPNRSFYDDSPAQESAALMALVASLDVQLMAHIDLHETTDTDNSEFRPALAARDAVEHTNWNIPDGFYLVGDSDNPCAEMQKAIIDAVAKVTHIAPADEHGRLIGVPVTQFGVINYPTKSLGLCTGFSNATFNTTTEVYPDSPLADAENCILAQVEAVTSALNYILNKTKTAR
ncbi:M14 family metallopeptidase [Shewanella psychrotolerans]|uniref:M14 family metallopeptidase n=1 Tax=Shewanella psychrotolerans TaxID=2864206 RepID=UPI001C65EA09|nr:M14 family metallocarboxypeptidase [Shewanella psychrotolerans]QYK00225.1 M14 family metallocarboxypeptidase [Shewanella psychrotolerans]